MPTSSASKSTLADGKVRFNAAVFYYDYNDFQAFTFQDLLNKLSNQDAEIYGFEAELQAPSRGSAGICASACRRSTRRSKDLTAQNRFTGASVPLGDREMALAPDLQVNGVARYTWPVWNGHLALQGDFTYMDDHFLDLDNNPTSFEDAYLRGNARVLLCDRGQSLRGLRSGCRTSATRNTERSTDPSPATVTRCSSSASRAGSARRCA